MFRFYYILEHKCLTKLPHTTHAHADHHIILLGIFEPHTSLYMNLTILRRFCRIICTSYTRPPLGTRLDETLLCRVAAIPAQDQFHMTFPTATTIASVVLSLYTVCSWSCYTSKWKLGIKCWCSYFWGVAKYIALLK